MQCPDFFNNIETLKLNDPLSDFLGTFKNGTMRFTYLDILKSTGHSCPTAAGAYLMCLGGLKELYGEALPVRGEIKVSFKNSLNEGVTGVVSSVISQITGASGSCGVKGINGKFAREKRVEKIFKNSDKVIKLQY